MARKIAALLYDARQLLGLGSQGRMGELLGSSVRSGQRWERGQAEPMASQLHELAVLVFPKDEALAAEIAESAGRTLEELGLVRAAALPPAPVPPPDPIYLVDSVVCAACEAVRLLPGAIRPALRAAFRRARAVGLTVEAVDKALSEPLDDPSSARQDPRTP